MCTFGWNQQVPDEPWRHLTTLPDLMKMNWNFMATLALTCSAAAGAPAAATDPPATISVEQAWNDEYQELAGQISRFKTAQPEWRRRLQAEALDSQALIQAADADPLDVVLRRTRALLSHFKRCGWIQDRPVNESESQLQPVSEEAKTASAMESRQALFAKVCAVRRRLLLAVPLLDFDRVLGMLEQPGDARIIEQARAVWPGHSRGGGPVAIAPFKAQLEVVPLLAGVRVLAGPWQGRELTGKFSGLELNWDGTEILFAATTRDEVWHLFKLHLPTKQCVQLTDGPDDDFDPCYLPSGRIAFVSTRRGGIGRCVLTPQSLTYTLYSMEPDGSDIVCLSFHETNEWAPSVSHDGKLVYTRWDYVDRHWGSAHHFWQCLPDGRDPRNFHGNYPLPWSAMPPGLQPDQYGMKGLANGRFLRPDVEMSFRAVPASPKYTATAVGHHEGFSGSLVLVDLTIPDDGKMAQVKRITPEYFFPEVEPGGTHTYGTAWPLSEDFMLCNFNFGLYLLDRFGNREMLYDPGRGAYRVRDPIPLRPRRTPPVIPVQTWQGRRDALPDHRRAVLSVMNVYATDEAGKFPEGVRVKWMRIVQVIPQMLIDRCCNQETITLTAFATDSIGRLPLGVVPVEADGSVYCEAPVGKALYFQLLDEQGLAVHSMRSATYVHPGEHLACAGCHEDKWQAVKPHPKPLALQRPPSKLLPEVPSGAVPFNFIQLVKAPVFDVRCVPCHKDHPKAPDMSYASLARYDRAFSYPGEAGLNILGVGGSRTAAGQFGARASGIRKALAKPQHKDVKLSDEERRRLTLWLDLNSNELGWIGNDRDDIAAQKRGEASWPPIDVDPRHPTGVEMDRPPPLDSTARVPVPLSAEGAGHRPTFCNPLNLDYGWSPKGYRHSADPVIVLFKDRYYLFATDDVPGCRVSDDLLSWTNLMFAPELQALMSDNRRGTYCAPAVATDGSHVYFIRMDRRKEARTVPVMRSADPASGHWEPCGELRKTGDPALFFDQGRAWLYHGLGQPTKVFEIDRKTWTEIPGSERQVRPAITSLANLFGGYERGRRELLDEEDAGAWLDKFTILPCQEAAWMTKHNGRYYLQYATPGTVTQWYGDTVMEGDSATGPFRHVDYAPASLKAGGFMGSAGHSCVFQDRHGNDWRATTMWVGVHDLFERRLGLFPVRFDARGRMFTETAFGDYPQVMPQQRRDSDTATLAGWRVQSFGKQCSASSSLTNHPPALAADEDCRTWWSAQTGNPGEWFQMDLGRPTRANALQLNFAEQDCVTKPVPTADESIRYQLFASDNGEVWFPLASSGNSRDAARQTSGAGTNSVREAVGPHDYLAFASPQLFRFVRVLNVSVPVGGKFALRDLRVFGPGEGQPPKPVTGLKITRHTDDDRNASLAWTPSPNADGYLIRFGIGPEHLYQTIQLQGGTNAALTTHALNRGVKYAWRVDAFNSCGVARGEPSVPD